MNVPSIRIFHQRAGPASPKASSSSSQNKVKPATRRLDERFCLFNHASSSGNSSNNDKDIKVPPLCFDRNSRKVDQSPTKPNRKRTSVVVVRRRGVQFRSRNSIEDVRRISTLSNYNTDEVIAVWGDENETTRRIQELQQEMSDLGHGRRESDNLTCTTVGLSHYGKRKAEKMEAREQTWHAVLWEQYRQFQQEDKEKEEKEQIDTFLRGIDSNYEKKKNKNNNNNENDAQTAELINKKIDEKKQKKRDRHCKILSRICRDVTRKSRRRAEKQAKKLEQDVKRINSCNYLV